MKDKPRPTFNINRKPGFVEMCEVKIERDKPSMINLQFKIYYKEQNIGRRKINS